MFRVSAGLSTNRESIIEEVQSPSIAVTVNGEPKTIPTGQSVSALLDLLAIGSDRVAVEMNKSLVRKRDWRQTTIHPGSQIEIVEFVGGG